MKPRRNTLPRRRRGLTAFLAALAVLALAVLATVAAIQIRYDLDRTALGKVSYVAERLRTRDWTDVGVLIAGIALAVVGLWFLLAGIVPARRQFIALTDVDEGTRMGITRAGLIRDLTAVSLAVDGVDSAQVRVRAGRVLGRRVRVRARSALRDVTGIDATLHEALTTRLELLAPLRTFRVRMGVAAAPAPQPKRGG